MNPSPQDKAPRYRIEFRRPGGEGERLGDVMLGLLPAARAFEAEVAHLAGAGERGTLALVCELGGHGAPIVARRVAPGTAD
jgi:hypothetical protein